MNPARPVQLQELHKAAGGYFFGGDYFTKQLDVFDNTYKLTKKEARGIAQTAQSYQIFHFKNEVASQMQCGLGILTVLYICILPAMLGIGRPSVTTGSIGVAGLLGGTIAITEIAKRINSKNNMRICGIMNDLQRKVPNYYERSLKKNSQLYEF
jgi:hypothetical protein